MATTAAPIPFYQHDLGQPELDAVASVLAGPILTTGETVARFESAFADYLGRQYALGVTSCTGALHMSLLALGIGPGDEVITTPLTFIATATAVLEAGASPVFVDVEPQTGNLDAARIERAITSRTKAILPVHLYGAMCDMRRIRALADRYGLALVEDSAHCIEGDRDDVRPGALANAACFSFYATKNLTCGEGGAVVTDDGRLAERLRLLRLHGMTKSAADRHREGYHHWDMVTMGWKYNLDNIQAALLLPQLARIEANWQRRDALARTYETLLAGVPGLSLPRMPARGRHARHLFTVWIHGGRRDDIVAALQRAGIAVMVNYRAIHELTYFRDRFGFRRGDFPNAETIGDSTISLPFYPSMPPEHVERVVELLKESLTQRT
jgi:UDP-4-amino-4-deoxy-L-arabinose-oxoglutarate aminotransferase